MQCALPTSRTLGAAYHNPAMCSLGDGASAKDVLQFMKLGIVAERW